MFVHLWAFSAEPLIQSLTAFMHIKLWNALHAFHMHGKEEKWIRKNGIIDVSQLSKSTSTWFPTHVYRMMQHLYLLSNISDFSVILHIFVISSVFLFSVKPLQLMPYVLFIKNQKKHIYRKSQTNSVNLRKQRLEWHCRIIRVSWVFSRLICWFSFSFDLSRNPSQHQLKRPKTPVNIINCVFILFYLWCMRVLHK